MTNVEIINKCIFNFDNNIRREISKIVKNIKYQYSLNSLFYTLDETIIVSNVLNEINITIHNMTNINIEDNTVYLNINPFRLNTSGGFYSIINKNIWILFYRYFEMFLIDVSPYINNIKFISVHSDYICKRFYEKVKHLPIINAKIVIKGTK